MSGESGEDGRLISRAGSYFEHAVVGRERQVFRHEGDNVGLADGLSAADGDRAVVVGVSPEFRREEVLARDAQQGVENRSGMDAASPNLVVDHPSAEQRPVGVVVGLFHVATLALAKVVMGVRVG